MILNLLEQILMGGETEAEILNALLSEHGVESPAQLTSNVAPRYINLLKKKISRLKDES